MRRTDPAQFVAVATLLQPLLDELVFVGGAITSLLVTDKGAGPPRTTLDVDAIPEITPYAEYAMPRTFSSSGITSRIVVF